MMLNLKPKLWFGPGCSKAHLRNPNLLHFSCESLPLTRPPWSQSGAGWIIRITLVQPQFSHTQFNQISQHSNTKKRNMNINEVNCIHSKIS